MHPERILFDLVSGLELEMKFIIIIHKLRKLSLFPNSTKNSKLIVYIIQFYNCIKEMKKWSIHLCSEVPSLIHSFVFRGSVFDPFIRVPRFRHWSIHSCSEVPSLIHSFVFRGSVIDPFTCVPKFRIGSIHLCSEAPYFIHSFVFRGFVIDPFICVLRFRIWSIYLYYEAPFLIHSFLFRLWPGKFGCNLRLCLWLGKVKHFVLWMDC